MAPPLIPLLIPHICPCLCPIRAKFLLESVADLKARLRDIGSDLAVAVGRPEDVIPGETREGRGRKEGRDRANSMGMGMPM
jgi:hypothetical protein